MVSNGHDESNVAAVAAENEELKRRLREAGAVSIGGSGVPPEVENRFLRQVLAFSERPTTTLAAELAQIGIELPEPAALSDAALTAKLWEVIHGLARLRVFLEQTDHLDDRALYELLHGEQLPEEMDALATDELSAWHLDILGTWGEEETRLYLKYYADEERRRSWLEDWPDYDMPAREDPPYDRDRLLPSRGALPAVQRFRDRDGIL
jgi:hypothetical protein